MFRLNVLGQIDLRDETGTELRAILSQPKRLALLVYLAAASPRRFHRRDELLALFWPEHAEEAARNALRQALYQLRQSLGGEVLVSRGGESLGVAPEKLRCDLVQFEDALDQGRIAEALSEYRGELLPGFSVPGASAFNEWVDDTNARLRHRAARAAWALAEQQERAGAREAAADSARRAASLTLHDEAALRQLVSLLDRIGDPTGAIQAYEEFAARLQRDLELEPSAETRSLVGALRARNRAAAASAASSPAPSAPGTREAARAGNPPPGRFVVAAAPFENLTGDPALDFVGRLAATNIEHALAETRLVDVVTMPGVGSDGAESASPAPERSLAVGGTFFTAGEELHLRATMRSMDGRTITTIAPVVARRDRPWEAARELSTRVSGAVAGHVDPNVASWADAVAEPHSLDAHHAHLLGMELHLRGEYRAAIPHFLRAASPETGFTIPLLWAVQASCNLGEHEQAAAIHETLSAGRSRLSPAERLGCDYFGAVLAGDRGSAYRAIRTVSQLLPDSEVLAQLGREAIFFNHPRHAVEVLDRLDPERGWMPSWTPYWRRLTEAYHMLGDHAREAEAARRGRHQHPEAVSTLLYEIRAKAALGEVEGVDRVADEAVAMTSDRFATAGEVLFTGSQELRAHGHRAASIELLGRAIAWQREHAAETPFPFPQRLLLARMLYEGTHWEKAQDIVLTLAEDRPDDIDLLGLRGALAARTGDAPAARAMVASLRSRTGRYLYGRHLVWAARIASILADSDEAISLLRGAFARGYSYGVDLHTDMDLMLLSGHARYAELLRPKG